LVVIVAAGDIEFSGMFLGRYEKQVLAKLSDKHKRLADHMRENAAAKSSELISKWFDEADVAFANLETNLTKPRSYYPSRDPFYHFRQDPSTAEDLKSMGFDLLNLANNYTFDQLVSGTEGFIDEVEALDRVGIKHVGAGMNLEEALAPVIIDTGGQRIAFLGFSNLVQKAATVNSPGVAAIRNKTVLEFASSSLPHETSPWYAGLPTQKELPYEEDVHMMQECIKGLKKKVDFVVVAVHWGEGTPLSTSHLGLHSTIRTLDPTDQLRPHRRLGVDANPNYVQRLLGHSMIDAGADLVIGGHPHSAQAVEIYKDKHIFYSLGEFFMQVEVDILRHAIGMYRAYMVKVEIEKKKTPRVEILPIRMDEACLPIINEEYADVIEALNEASLPLNASLVPYDKGAIVKPVTQ